MKGEDAIGVAFILVVAIAIVSLCYLEHQLNAMKAEAVKRGHAEWYATTEGRQPTQWRWKEGRK